MSIINIFLDTISGNTQALVGASESYKELFQEVYNLDLPTFATDKKALYKDRRAVADDFKNSFKQYKEKWQNNNNFFMITEMIMMKVEKD